MTSSIPRILAIFIFSMVFPGALIAQENAAPAVEKAPAADADYNPDIDLQNVPDYYRDRVMEFRKLIRKQPSRKAKIDTALGLAKNPKSKYRNDAISFLGEIKARETVPELRKLAKDPEVREFVLFTLGQLQDPSAIPTLIYYLNDESENVRGNAERSLELLARQEFGYHYFDSEADRKKEIRKIKIWWEKMHKNLKPIVQTEEEKKEAEEAWRKYGIQYLNR